MVGGLDRTVIELIRAAAEHLMIERCIEIIPGATHLFEEPGTLEEVARLALEWFQRCFNVGEVENGSRAVAAKAITTIA